MPTIIGYVLVNAAPRRKGFLMYRFVTRSIRALGNMLADTFVRLGNDPSIGWLSDDACGWDWRYLYFYETMPATFVVPADGNDGVMGVADSRKAQPAFSHVGMTA